ncbi:alpha/beta hydrolase [Streptomyces sp. NPDC049577]|uniref:alpha/beta fold hydrolase n=1 Tax=Streptomyces sp. NPDC049577 TaxID=3155153 RepID=UPI0034251E30
MGSRLGSFTGEAARARVLAAYDRAMARWPQPYEESEVVTRFGTSRVYGYGPDTGGIPVVLLAGQNATPAEWAPHVVALAEGGRRVIALDRVGEPGYSTQTAPITTADDTAAWLEEALAGLGVERAHLVGHSYGGWVALNHAVRAPGRVASVAVCDPPRVLAPIRPGFVLATVAALLSGSESYQLRWFRGLIGETGDSPESADVQTRLGVASIRGFRVRLLPPQRLSDDELRSIAVPTLVMLGGDSPVVDARRAAERANRLIPGVRTEIVPGVRHGIPVEQWNSRVPEFIRESETALDARS